MAGFSDKYLDDLYINDDLKIAQTKLVELIVQECVDRITLEFEDSDIGNCFGGKNGEILWESVTTEYGKVASRDYDPIGISNHITKITKKHFGVE